ncbi:hypothetical protein ACA910_016524 [Epithemia clementina (nom. ined.)]
MKSIGVLGGVWQWTFHIIPIVFLVVVEAARIPLDGRHSYSLSTFDTEGRLGQVDWAIQAASQGTPIMAVVVPDDDGFDRRENVNSANIVRGNGGPSILLAAPQSLPSVLMEDDGTSRFAYITSEIVVAHSGLSADGRVLVAAAQRFAVQHEYTFDEEIPIDIFLQELSLLFQEYTMKQATRPFGVILLIAYLPTRERHGHQSTTARMPRHKAQLFRLDPSGTVSGLGSFAMINGKDIDSPVVRQSLLDATMGKSTRIDNSEDDDDDDDSKNSNDKDNNSNEASMSSSVLATSGSSSARQHNQIASLLRDALVQEEAKKQTEEGKRPYIAIVTAVLSRSSGFSVQRHPIASSASTT